MEISPKQLAKFKLLCEQRGFMFDDYELRDWALRLMNLVAITRGPLPPKTESYEQ